MYHIKEDQRAKRSANLIYDALVSLMAEKAFEAITVSDIVAQADIGRSTFYRNFDLIEDVLLWQCDHTMDQIHAYVTQYKKSQPLEMPFPLLKPILRFFYLDSTIVELLIAAKQTDLLQMAIMERFQRGMADTANSLNIPEVHLQYGAVIRSHTAVGILVHWVKTGKREAPDALADGLKSSMIKSLGKIEDDLFL